MSAYTDDEIARRQIRVGELAMLRMTKAQIAKQLGVSFSLVRSDCEAMELNIPDGIHRKPVRTAPVTQHGTITGYAAHYKRQEQPCEECKQARREYLAQRKAS